MTSGDKRVFFIIFDIFYGRGFRDVSFIVGRLVERVLAVVMESKVSQQEVPMRCQKLPDAMFAVFIQKLHSDATKILTQTIMVSETL